MTEDLNPSKPEIPESPAPSPEPSPQSEIPFIPKLGVKEIRATWEMLVEFKKAIIENQYWPGNYVQAVAMGLQMVKQMEVQYRGQLEMAERNEKEAIKRAKAAIQSAGGSVNGEPATTTPNGAA